MKRLLLLIASGVVMTACSTTSPMVSNGHNSVKHPEAFQMVTDITRAGDKAQKITLSHEMGCKNHDCGSAAAKKYIVGDQQRFEKQTNKMNAGQKHWLSFSVYLDNNWQSLYPVKTTIFQSKTTNVDQPHWQIATHGQHFVLLMPNYHDNAKCVLAWDTKMKGKWTDFTVYVDYSQKDKSDPEYKFLSVSVNGKEMCSRTDPIVIPKLENRSGFECGKSCQARLMTYRYGQYRWPVSEWFKRHSKNTDLIQNYERSTGNVFAQDWGVKIPTNTIYFDEFRIGNTLESVQIDQNNPVD